MVKEIVISTISVIAIVVGNNVTNSYANETLENINEEIKDLRSVISSEEVNSEEAKEKIDEVFETWQEKQTKLAYFEEHDELEKIEQGLTEIKGNIEMEENQEAVVQADKTMFIINHLQEKLNLRLENIF